MQTSWLLWAHLFIWGFLLDKLNCPLTTVITKFFMQNRQQRVPHKDLQVFAWDHFVAIISSVQKLVLILFLLHRGLMVSPTQGLWAGLGSACLSLPWSDGYPSQISRKQFLFCRRDLDSLLASSSWKSLLLSFPSCPVQHGDRWFLLQLSLCSCVTEPQEL